MRLLNRILTTTFDRMYLRLSKEKTCGKLLDRDLFDGQEFTIDKFCEEYSQYFNKPWDFYSDYGSNGAISLSLRDGVHPREKQPVTTIGQMMVFDSPIETDWKETNLAPFKWFTTKDRRSHTMLLFAPGWGSRNQRVEEKMAFRLLKKHGVDVGLLTVPYQQARTPKGAYSGEYFISANIFWTIANFRHLVVEMRQLLQYMRDYYNHVGLIGMSSGGFQAVLASNCEDVDFLFSIITGCDLGGITWNGAITQALRRDLEKKGIDQEQLRKVWSITDERLLGRHCKARYRKNFISLYDTVVPTEYQLKLWDVLGRPEKCELECGHHSTVFFTSKVVDQIGAFVNKCVAHR